MIDPLDPDVEVLPMNNSLHAALSGIWPDLTKADRQRVAEAVTQEQAAVIRELRADLERAEAEADRLREERDAYIDALDTIRRDHSLVGLAGTVLNRYGRLYPEDGDR